MNQRIALAGVTALAAFAAQGALAADFIDTAPVVATSPIVERVNTPQQECWNEQVVTQAPSGGSALGAIVGGIAGGVIGHQIGGGRGNAVATGVGAVAGAVVGDKVDPNGGVITGNSNAGTREQTVQRCRRSMRHRGIRSRRQTCCPKRGARSQRSARDQVDAEQRRPRRIGATRADHDGEHADHET